jgi:hypothetical protein
VIDPAGIPVIAGDMDVLAGHAATLSWVGTAFGETGARVHAVWQGLGAVYVAPEAGQLLAATGPVATVSASVGEDITTAGDALAAYAAEVAVIKARLESLRAQATAFVDSVASRDDWRDDQGTVDHHNALISGVDAAVADFMDAQRRCANAVLALYTDRRFTADNGDETVLPTEYGYSAEQLDAVMGQDGVLPWGTGEERDRGFLGNIGAYFGGIGDGFTGMVSGFGALIGYSEGDWSWSTAGTAWQGLATFGIALSAYTNPVSIIMDQTIGYGGYEKGKLGDTLLGAGKATIAYDEWGHDKSRAAGMATFNVVSAILGTKGAGATLRGVGAAAEASRFAAVARVGSGLTRAGDAIGALPTARDVLGAITSRFPSLHVPHVEIAHTDLPPTHVDAPPAPAPLVRSEPLPTQELQSTYRGEDDPTNPNRAFYPRTVHYMSPRELETHRVVVADGDLHWASDGARLDTAGAQTFHSGDGRAMYVMDENGNLYVSLRQVPGALHHSSFLGGAPVAGAGELVVRDGDVTIISRKSGHYQPTAAQQQAVVDALAEQGLDVSRIHLESGF